MAKPFALTVRRAGVAGVLFLLGCASPRRGDLAVRVPSAPTVGPPRGSVIVVGGGSLGPEIYAKFIERAGGPSALIVDVPTAGGDSVYSASYRGTQAWKAAGVKNIVVLHTIDRRIADSDSFVAPLKRAGGVWFEGGRQYHLVDRYAGTKTEREFHNVLARGGVVGGSSAGASILGSFLVRGAPSNNNFIIVYPGYETGFGFLRGVGIDQHVVARERLPDLADSLLPRHPEVLGISEDEGTAWVVRGDVGEIIGRNKAFVYGGKDANDPGKPFLTLYPGDRYDLAARRVIRRAIDDTPITHAFIDSLFAGFGAPGAPAASVLVAQEGRVLIDKSYGISAQPKYMPTTTMPNSPLGNLGITFQAMAAQLAARDGKLRLDDPIVEGGDVTIQQFLSRRRQVADGDKPFADLVAKAEGMPYSQFLTRRLFTPIGARRTLVGTDGQFHSNVDELYRWSLGLENVQAFTRDTLGGPKTAAPLDPALGWNAEKYRGLSRFTAYGAPDGKRNAFVRIPSRRVSIIILTSSDAAAVGTIADRISDRLLFTK
jgi:cyanophycinase